MNHELVRPEHLFDHLFAGGDGYLVTFTGQQARFTNPDARQNELADIEQRSWRYPEHAIQAAEHLIGHAQLERDSYVAAHLFRMAGNRLSKNAMPTISTLWLDEDDGEYPDEGPEPTVVIHSSKTRRQLYWRLTQPVSVEWAVVMNRRVAKWAGGDTGKSALSSVLRAPGTANYKRHPRVDLVGGFLTGARPWEPVILDQAIPPLPREDRESRRSGPYDGPELELGPFLENVDVLRERPDSKGVCFEIICPWLREHSGGDRTGTRVGQRENGALWFHCDHAHCEGRTWREFKNELRRRAGGAQARRGSSTIRMEVVNE